MFFLITPEMEVPHIAWQQGYNAFLYGYTVLDNPYRQYNLDRWWYEGFCSARREERAVQ